MQVTSTLIAAQQAAQQAAAKFQPPAKAGFAAVLDKSDAGAGQDFAPLPLKQVSPQPAPVAASQQASRPGAMLDIRI